MVNEVKGFFGDYRFLSNFWYVDIEYDGLIYKTVEHAYQAAKTLNLQQRQMVAGAKSPAEAKKLGYTVDLRADWEEIKLDVMYSLLLYKFSHKKYRDKLLSTGDAYLEETNTWGDKYWGVCDGVVENHLGKLLMRVRDWLIINKTQIS